MANIVHSSPGVYTSEKDLAYSVETIGVTTLGAVGETIKGPAFQPIPVSNYDQFSTVFGGISPDKFKNTQIPKYELSYIAKSYLSQSNQLYVTRILGLSGYDKGDAFAIRTIGAIDRSTVTSGVTYDSMGESDGIFCFTGSTLDSTPTYNIVSTETSLLSVLVSKIPNINTSKFIRAFNAYFPSFNTATGSTGNYWTHDVVKYGVIPSFETLQAINTAKSSNYNNSQYENNNPIIKDAYVYPASLPSSDNDTYFINTEYAYDSGDNNYAGYGFIFTTSDMTKIGDMVIGYLRVKTMNFFADPYLKYHNKLVSTLRSRALYAGDSLVFNVSGSTVGYTPSIDTTGAVNPYSEFVITGQTTTHTNFSYNVSLDSTKPNYIKKVLGITNTDKSNNLYVEECYDASLAKGWLNGYVKGLNPTLTYIPAGADGWNHFKFQYQSPSTPYFVSELNGGIANRLFRVVSISDGDHANTEVKISIANINLANKTFDLLVRAFSDSDKSPVILEKYTNCVMDPTSSFYVGRLVGTIDNAFTARSAYVLIDIDENASIDSVPCGFEGYEFRTFTNVGIPIIPYKTKYYKVGDVWESNPFGTPLISNGDKVRKTYLGFSDIDYGYDSNITSYKGKVNTGSLTYNTGNDWGSKTNGYHLDVNADTSIYSVGDGQFTDAVLLATDNTQTYYDIRSRKFTALMAGGFDGWDMFRDNRTNGDNYKLGKTGYINGLFSSAFTLPTYDESFGSSDYYAYLYGYLTMQNPEEVSINILVTPGIDVTNNNELVQEVITIVEEKRLDSIYLPTLPDIELYNNNNPADTSLWKYPNDIQNDVENANLDSNYTAIYYPWIQISDVENNVYLWIPPTAEVAKNMAYTDNIAFPWYATAGYNRGIVNSNRTRIVLGQPDRDILYPARVNPIATFSDVGTVIMGNRNLQTKDSPLNEINVRRLLLQARRLIISVSNRLLFDPNDPTIRTQFLSLVNPILDNIRKERGLSDFRVKLDPVSDLARKSMKGKIYIKPVDALEFIELEFDVSSNSVSFANI